MIIGNAADTANGADPGLAVEPHTTKTRQSIIHLARHEFVFVVVAIMDQRGYCDVQPIVQVDDRIGGLLIYNLAYPNFSPV